MLKDIGLLLFLSVGVFLLGNTAFHGSLAKPENLSGELKSPPDSLFQWNIGTQPPFKYRLLHRSIVLGTYHLIAKRDDNQLFFRVYQVYAIIFQVAATFAIYLLLIVLNMQRASLWGAALFSVMPPMLMAYSVPVHTREDMLAYFLLSVGLIFIIKNQVAGMVIIFFLAILCRETLLLLPLVNLLFNRSQSLWIRLTVFASSILVFAAVRFISGAEIYNAWEGLQWNIVHKLQVVGFLFISFGFLWLPFLIWIGHPEFRQERTAFFHRSSVVVLIVIATTTFLGGVFNEIRLLYLLAPWVVVGTLELYLSRRNTIKQFFHSRGYLLFAVILLVGFAVGTFVLIQRLDKMIPPSEHTIAYASWAVITAVHLYLTCVSLPLLLKSVK